MAWMKKSYQGVEDLWARSSSRKRRWLFAGLYTVLFLLTFSLAYSPFLLAGKSFIWKNDGQYQHYRTLLYLGTYLRQILQSALGGQLTIPLFDLDIALGENVLSALNYYGLNDPLNLTSVLVPARYTEYLYCALVVARLYLAGLAFSALCACNGKRASHTLVGALLYVFSGYAIYSAVRHPFFINPMIQMPLLVIGVDRVMRKERPWIFLFTVFYSALCGFYFLYMMTLLLGIYVLVRFFDIYREKRVREFFAMAWRIVRNYLLGVGLAAVCFLPAVLGYLSSSRSGETIQRDLLSYGWEYYRANLLRLIAPPASWNALSLAAIVLPAVILLLSEKRRRSLKWLLAALASIYLLPLGGCVMNGFSYPSQRWTFAAALLLAYITVELLPELLTMTTRQKILCLCALAVYALCVYADAQNRSACNVAGTVMLAVTLAVLSALSAWGRRSACALLCALLVAGNAAVNAFYKFSEEQGNYISEFPELGLRTEEVETAAERTAAAELLEDGSGRAEGTMFTRNNGMIWDVPTTYFYWSIVNGNVTDLWQQTENIGQELRNFLICGTDRRTILSTLLSTRYFFADRGDDAQVPYGYTAVLEDGDQTVYENDYALPWGYTYDSFISYEDLEDLNGLEREEAMLYSIALEGDVDGVARGSVESAVEDVPYEIAETDGVTWADGVLRVEKAYATMTLEFQLPAGTEGYLRLQGYDMSGSALNNSTITVDCGDVRETAQTTSSEYTWYFGRENYLFNLGYSESQRTACRILFPTAGTYQLEAIQLLSLPMDGYPAQAEALRAEPLENIEWGTDCFSGTVDLSGSKILCVSVPYSDGWIALVDGEETEILRGNYMFMALPLTAGHHEITFVYHTPGLRVGAVCSAVSLAVLAGLWRRGKRRGKSHEKG